MSQDLLNRVLDSPRLPSLPAIALEVIELVQNPNVDLKTIAGTIQHDPALASKILKTVNSSFYAQPKQITTVTNALIVLGLNSVKTLALGFSLVNNLKGSSNGGFDPMAFWKRCVYSATAAKVLYDISGGDEPEEAFLGALLQDLGMLALNAELGDPYAAVCAGVDQHYQLAAAEREAFGLDHSQVGAALAEKWRLPQVLIDAITYHEKPESCNTNAELLVRCVSLGNQCAELLGEDVPESRAQIFTRRAMEWLSISHKQIPALLEDVHEKSKEVQKLLEIDTGDLGGTDEIMARANEAMQQVTLQTAMEAQQLAAQNVQLTEKATKDPLTGAINRGGFDEFVEDAFENVKQGAGPLSILFMDTDHFKKFNDTYGHQVGDRVLVGQARLLESLCPSQGIVARYGGEEFAIVLPETDRRTATVFAEEVRKAVEAMDSVQDDDGKTLTITNSIGVATYDGTVFKSASQLVKAADQGVYAAKQAGRNRVRVFTPRAARKPAA